MTFWGVRQYYCAVALLVGASAAAQQIADPDFDASVERPAYTTNGPTIAIDQAHWNFHTMTTGYQPFAELLRNDGYAVQPATQTFAAEMLAGIDILVISNAGVMNRASPGAPAFTEQECDAVRDWVRDGGSLLLIADHAPAGAAAEILGQRFGVAMGKGWVFDRSETQGEITTQLVFSRDNGLLGEHPLLHGRSAADEVRHLRSFTGQSLGVPEGATVLMRLSATARETPTVSDLDAIEEAMAANTAAARRTVDALSTPVTGRAQGIAMAFGEGKVVVLGEAAMLSAQIARFEQDGQQREIRAGMNVPGTDDRQFALNVLHWLSGALQ